MSWDILPKGNLRYFLQKLKAKFDLKVDKEAGKGLSTNDFTTEEKNKLSGIEAGAQVNPTIDSALSDSSTNPVQNKVVKGALDNKAGREEIPSVNDNTITIQLNGTTIQSFTLNQITDETINIQVTKSSVGLGNVPNVSTDDQTPTFTQASARANIASGEKLSVIFGKIMKWFADLKTVAFSGSYNDLSNKPTIPAAVAVKGNAESTYRTGNVNITPANIGLGNVNNTADSNKNVNSANKVNYTKSTSEGTFTYPCEVEGTLSNSEDKIPNSAAVVSYLNSNLNAYCTPFQFPNSNVTQRSFKFSGLGQNESIHLLLFLRYGAYEVRGFCGPSDFNSVLVGKLESNSVDLSVAPVSGAYQFALAVGQWTAGFGFFIHPHYPNAKLTIF